VLAGLDSLYIGFYGRPQKTGQYFLSQGRKEVLVRDIEFNIKPGRRGPYNLILDNSQLSLFLDNSAPVISSPSVYVQLKSEFIWSAGVRAAYHKTLELVRWIYGGNLETEKISRADLFADLVYPRGFKSNDITNFVTRAKIKTTHHEGNTVTGFTIGRDYLTARIYDKVLEAQKHRKEWLYDLWNLSGNSKESIWRVEFQLRRQALGQFGIESFDDLLKASSSVWAYCTGKWLSMRQAGSKRVSRRPLTRLWEAVQAADVGLSDESYRFERSTGTRSSMTEELAVNIIAGIVRSFARSHEINSPSLAHEYLLSAIRMNLQLVEAKSSISTVAGKEKADIEDGVWAF